MRAEKEAALHVVQEHPGEQVHMQPVDEEENTQRREKVKEVSSASCQFRHINVYMTTLHPKYKNTIL